MSQRGASGERAKDTNAVEVETITEHQLPKTQWLDLERLDGTEEGETELKMTGERWGRRRRERSESGAELTEAV